MARKVVTIFEDDLTGKEVAQDDIHQVKFTVDGIDYLLEGASATTDKFYKALEPFTAAATRIGGRTQRGRAGKRSTAEQLDRIREWARENGYEVSDRGRIAGNVVEAYNAANGAN